MRKMTRREFVLTALNTSIIGSLGYAHLFEPINFKVTQNTLRLGTGRRYPLRILHLSDLHFSHEVPLTQIEAAIQLGIQENPDLICLTGDYITAKLENADLYSDVLRQLVSVAPTFATVGNHDGGKWAAGAGGYDSSLLVRKVLEKSGIRCLHNANDKVVLKGEILELVGLGDAWSEEMDVRSAFSGLKNSSKHSVICLSHNPDTKEVLREYRWDLMLSGHTHGGQFVVPFVGGAPFAPVQDKRYVHGLKPWHERFINVTSGVGNVLGVRFNCPPEVSIIDLV